MLLSTTSVVEAYRLEQQLDKHNEECKIIEQSIVEKAKQIANFQIKDKTYTLLFIVGNGWHQGVIGTVANILKETYHKPIAVISMNNGIGKASCRSIEGIDVGTKILDAKKRKLILSGGGQSLKAGFMVEETKLNALQQYLNIRFSNDMRTSKLHREEYYDAEITTSEAILRLVHDIERLEPFGVGKSTPVFRFSHVILLKVDVLKLNHTDVVFASQNPECG